MTANFVAKGVAHVPVPHHDQPIPVTFVLLHNFSLIAFSSAIEPLRIANQLAGRVLFEWSILSETGAPVACSNGLVVGVDGAIGDTSARAMLFVCGGVEPEKSASRRVADWLRAQWRNGRSVGGLCTGAYVLAKAGLLQGRRFTLHWENLPPFAATFPNLAPLEQLYCIDDRILTCAGGAAATDLFIELVARHHGARLGDAVLKMCLHGQQRPANLQQRLSLSSTLGIRNPLLVSVIRQFEGSIEADVDLGDIADRLGTSRRHIERMFERHVGTSPKRYLKELRLERARALLTETDKSVRDVAEACGFNSANAFAKSFRQKYGVAPRHVTNMVQPLPACA
ncbi:GlxA family transcriptional regulator [Paragemmobacter straminiformis]|uniref:GlxA family transcriptional regulator n=1 Tax=Paragemmobacter straminiformis TaxID=2045119 RepID=A0A842I4N6_9RHOB|nr:GlxA family transcriptional regulator [Gemmobacter straminiformis]MBC2835092.1 GlxA family transcriptional regulator [Gemmobacter straminiformis]